MRNIPKHRALAQITFSVHVAARGHHLETKLLCELSLRLPAFKTRFISRGQAANCETKALSSERTKVIAGNTKIPRFRSFGYHWKRKRGSCDRPGGCTPVRNQLHVFAKMDTLGFEPRAFRMRSGCDTTTPCARLRLSTRSPSHEWS